MTLIESLNLVIDAMSALLIPFVLFFLGQWYLRSKDRSDSARRDAAQLAAYIEHLSSKSSERRKLALLALAHMQNADLFPKALLQSVESIAARDDPEIAAAARLALGKPRPQENIRPEDRMLLIELLLPLKVHFDRSRQAFQLWVQNPPAKPIVVIEDAIKASNSQIRSILTNKWHMIPADLQSDAIQLIQHYDAWTAEYERLRPGGVRDPDVPYVFAGPGGVPFPITAEQRFLARYATLIVDGSGPEIGN